MKSTRSIATAIGTLFLIALIFNIIASSLLNPVLNGQEALRLVYTHTNQIIIGNLLNCICAVAMIFIPILFWPIIKQTHRASAITYVVFRGLEGIFFLFIAVKTLSLIDLSKEYQGASSQNTSILKQLFNSIQGEVNWATSIYILIYICGAIAFYTSLYNSKLVPRFLSGWGLFSLGILLTGGLLGLFHVGIFARTPLMEGMVYFAPPIAFNELVLSFWLIIKGVRLPIVPVNNYNACA